MADTMVEKPADCTCDFPDTVFRNMIGHHPSCAAYQRLHDEMFGKAVGAIFGEDVKQAIEDRGWTAYVWRRRYSTEVSFSRLMGIDGLPVVRHVVSVPISWSFAQSPQLGVVLKHTLASRGTLTADDVYGLACENKDGFRLKD